MRRVLDRASRVARGFTIIELLVAVIVTTIAFVALFDLQASSLQGLRNTRRMVQANMLASNFLENLRLEFMSWTGDAGGQLEQDETEYPHLAQLPVGGAVSAGAQTPGGDVADAPGWVIAGPADDSDRRVSFVGAPHPLGYNEGIREAMVEQDLEGAERPFCLHYRLTWLIPNRAIRAEVEVSWPLDGANMDEFMQCSQLAANRLGEMRSVTLTSTISVNFFRR